MDVTLIGNGSGRESAEEKLNTLPKEVRVLYWKRSYPATDEEYVCHQMFMDSDSKEVPEMLKDFYSRELRRVLGMSKFDYAVIFTSKKKFFPVLSGKLDVKKVYGAKNWQKVLEIPE